jgi:hypothetical protein
MNRWNYTCKYCRCATSARCPECNVACCLACGANVCPLCVRIKLAQVERALRERLVPWQHVDVTMMPIRRAIIAQTENINPARDDSLRRTIFLS